MEYRNFLRRQRKGQLLILLAVNLVWVYVLYLFTLMSHELWLKVKGEPIAITPMNGVYLSLFYATPFSIPFSAFMMWFYFFKLQLWKGLLWGIIPLVVLIVTFTTFYMLSSIA